MALGFNQDAEKRFFQNLLNLGYSPASAAGNMGNVMAESGFNPNAFNSEGGGKGAWGGYQWRADRQDFAKQYMKDQGLDPGDIWSHGLTAHHEAMTNPAAAGIDIKKFMGLDDPSEAAVMWRRDFERPGADPRGYERAIRYAQEVYNKYSGLEPVKERAGYKFAEDADNRAKNLQDLYAKNSELDPFRTSMIMRSLMPGNFEEATKQLDMGTGQLAGQRGSLDMGTPTGQQPRDPRSGAASRAAANTGTPSTVPSPTSPNKVSTNDEAAPAEKPKLLDRIFKTREGEEAGTPVTRRESFKDALNALSIGLGQMSHGQPVDVVSPIAQIQDARARRRDAASQHELDNEMRARTMALQEAQLQLGIDRHGLDVAEFRHKVGEGGASGVDWSTVENAVANNPHLEPLFNMAKQGGDVGTEAQKQLFQALGDLGVNPATPPVTIGPEGAKILDALSTGAKTPQQLISELPNITDEAEREEVAKYVNGVADDLNNRYTSAIKNANEVFSTLPQSEQTPQKRRELIQKFAQAGGGIDAFTEKKQNAETVTALNTHRQEANDAAAGYARMGPLIQDTLNTTIDMAIKGGQGGPGSGLIASGLKLVRQLKGGKSEAADIIEEALGYPTGALDQLSEDGTAFMYGMMEQLGFGGAGFTEKEAAMLRSIQPSDLATNESRARLLSRMQADDVIASVTAQMYNDATVDTFHDVDTNVSTNLTRVRTELSKMFEALTLSKFGGENPSSEYTLTQVAGEIAAARSGAASEEDKKRVKAEILKKHGVTSHHFDQFVRRFTPRMTLDQAQALSQFTPDLVRIVTPDGSIYTRQPQGWVFHSKDTGN